MASFRVNGDLLGISGGMEVIEVTQEEYNALMPIPLTDGKLYKITDAEDSVLLANNIKYNNTNVADALTWKELGSVIGQNTINLPSEWRELSVAVYEHASTTTRGYSFRFTRNQAKKHTYYLDGFYNNSGANGIVGIMLYEDRIQLYAVNSQGTSQINNYTMYVEYR